jgi:hypothetical protein
MKKNLLLIPFLMFISCSAPKFAANRTTLDNDSVVAGSSSTNLKYQRAEEGEATASLKTVPFLTIEKAKTEIKKNYFNLSKGERKEVRQLLKKEIKSIVKSQKKEMSTSATKSSSIDHDLKLAAIFGAVGIVSLILGGPAGQFFTVIGAIALIIGVVFFVKWLIRQ